MRAFPFVLSISIGRSPIVIWATYLLSALNFCHLKRPSAIWLSPVLSLTVYGQIIAVLTATANFVLLRLPLWWTSYRALATQDGVHLMAHYLHILEHVAFPFRTLWPCRRMLPRRLSRSWCLIPCSRTADTVFVVITWVRFKQHLILLHVKLLSCNALHAPWRALWWLSRW